MTTILEPRRLACVRKREDLTYMLGKLVREEKKD